MTRKKASPVADSDMLLVPRSLFARPDVQLGVAPQMDQDQDAVHPLGEGSSLLARSDILLELAPLVAEMEQDREAVHPFCEGGSLPAPSPPGFLAASSIQTTDLEAAAGRSGTSYPSGRPPAALHRVVSMRGSVPAQAGRHAGSPVDRTPFRRAATLRGNVRVAAATSMAPMRSTFHMRGELVHAFISYRVATEGMVLTLHQSSAETFCPAPRFVHQRHPKSSQCAQEFLMHVYSS